MGPCPLPVSPLREEARLTDRVADGDSDPNPAPSWANLAARSCDLTPQLRCGGAHSGLRARSLRGEGPGRQADSRQKQAPSRPRADALPPEEHGARSPARPSRHLRGGSCTWVVGPQGGATLPPAPGATHRLLTTKGPRGLSPAPPPALRRAFQAPQCWALAWVPAAVALRPAGIGRTCCAYTLGSEITGHPLHAWHCAPKSSRPHLTLLEGQVASSPCPHQFNGSVVRTYCVRAREHARDPDEGPLAQRSCYN